MYLDYAPKPPRDRRAHPVVEIGLVFVAHCMLQFVAYPSMSFPTLAAAAGYVTVFARLLPKGETADGNRTLLLLILSAAATLLSAFLSMLLPVNLYGT